MSWLCRMPADSCSARAEASFDVLWLLMWIVVQVVSLSDRSLAYGSPCDIHERGADVVVLINGKFLLPARIDIKI